MFRLNVPQLNSMLSLAKSKLLGRANETTESPVVVINRTNKIDNPWQEDLDKLVQDRYLRPTAQEDIDACMAKLSNTCLEAQNSNYSQQQILEEERDRAKRANKETAHDIKVWWGDSLSSWEPEVIQPAPEQKARQRAIQRWFYK